jgi:hypothetical protein
MAGSSVLHNCALCVIMFAMLLLVAVAEQVAAFVKLFAFNAHCKA